jgi:hypothetical protein
MALFSGGETDRKYLISTGAPKRGRLVRQGSVAASENAEMPDQTSRNQDRKSPLLNCFNAIYLTYSGFIKDFAV